MMDREFTLGILRAWSTLTPKGGESEALAAVLRNTASWSSEMLLHIETGGDWEPVAYELSTFMGRMIEILGPEPDI